MFPPNSYVEMLTPNVMLLGVGTFKRWFDHKDRTLVKRISALIKETPASHDDKSTGARTRLQGIKY